MLDPFALRTLAESQLPEGFRVSEVVFDMKPSESVEFRVNPPDGAIEGTPGSAAYTEAAPGLAGSPAPRTR